jgi:hypothetical protein
MRKGFLYSPFLHWGKPQSDKVGRAGVERSFPCPACRCLQFYINHKRMKNPLFLRFVSENLLSLYLSYLLSHNEARSAPGPWGEGPGPGCLLIKKNEKQNSDR